MINGPVDPDLLPMVEIFGLIYSSAGSDDVPKSPSPLGSLRDSNTVCQAASNENLWKSQPRRMVAAKRPDAGLASLLVSRLGRSETSMAHSQYDRTRD